MEANMIDIANYQGTSLNFAKLKTQGITKVAIKLTQGSASGTAYKNEYRQFQVQGAKSAGQVVMPYHYLVSISPADAQAEADFFLSVVREQGLPLGTPLALDVEEPFLYNRSDLVAMINAFFNYCWDKGYHNLFIYGSLSWFQAGKLNPNNFTHKPKTWVAAYPYGTPNKASRPYNCDVWQFASNWGNQFPGGYWGGGLDVNWDYNNSVSYLGSANSTQEEGELLVAYPEMSVISYGILVFSKDTKINNRTFKQGSAWQVVNNYYKDHIYDLGGNVKINPTDPNQAWVFVQPNPYRPDDATTAKGLAVRVRYQEGYGVALRQEPSDKAPYTVRPTNAYMPKGNNPQDGHYYIFREQGAWRVVGVKVSENKVWVSLGVNAWAKLLDFNIVVGR